MHQTRASHPVDEIMERASALLAAMRPFDAERLAIRALEHTLRAKDWERLARIVMPLQEARRLRRQIATDAGRVRLIDTRTQLRARPEPGCYLIQPPLIGADARAFRASAIRRAIPVFTLAREPMTNEDLWPVVAVSSISVRTKVAPPPGVVRTDKGVTKDSIEEPIPVSWFESTAEALGDAAIQSVDPQAPAAHRVEDLIERIDALPEHEKLHQALHRAAEEAFLEPAPTFERRRGRDIPNSF